MHQRVIDYETGLPVGFDRVSGDLVTFEEARSSPNSIIPSDRLTQEQRVELAMQRVDRAADWPERELHPGGPVDQDRARSEIAHGGDIGDLLVETEVRVAAWVIDNLAQDSANA